MHTCLGEKSVREQPRQTSVCSGCFGCHAVLVVCSVLLLIFTHFFRFDCITHNIYSLSYFVSSDISFRDASHCQVDL